MLGQAGIMLGQVGIMLGYVGIMLRYVGIILGQIGITLGQVGIILGKGWVKVSLKTYFLLVCCSNFRLKEGQIIQWKPFNVITVYVFSRLL